MEKIFKNINILYIIHNDTILMRKFTHQDYQVIDVFAFMDNGNADIDIKNKLSRLFGESFPYSHCGTIESIINKEGVTAYLNIKTYKVLLTEKHQVLDEYTDDVVNSGQDTLWISKDDIKNEKRLREGDKKILERVFDDRKMDIKIIEDQGERWIDAKTVSFEDR